MAESKPFTEEELAKYKEIFDELDTDGDGVISHADLRKVLNEAGWVISDEEIQEIIDRVDADGNGTVCWDEFLKVAEDRPIKKRVEANMRRMFRVLGADNSGFITADNLRQLMAESGGELSADEAEKLIAEVDVNGDGQISFEEFVTVFMQ